MIKPFWSHHPPLGIKNDHLCAKHSNLQLGLLCLRKWYSLSHERAASWKREAVHTTKAPTKVTGFQRLLPSPIFTVCLQLLILFSLKTDSGASNKQANQNYIYFLNQIGLGGCTVQHIWNVIPKTIVLCSSRPSNTRGHAQTHAQAQTDTQTPFCPLEEDAQTAL